MSKIIRICSFCCRDRDSLSDDLDFSEASNKLLLKQFLKSAQTYLGTNFHFNQIPVGSENERGTLLELESCKECLLVVESFCKLYDELKRLEIEVEWRLRKIMDIINNSDHVGSRRQLVEAGLYDKHKEERNVSEQLASFRTKFQQKCIQKYTKSFPRVVLKRLDYSPRNHDVNAATREKKPLQNYLYANQLFLGWVSTLSAVLSLGGLFEKTLIQDRDEDADNNYSSELREMGVKNEQSNDHDYDEEPFCADEQRLLSPTTGKLDSEKEKNIRFMAPVPKASRVPLISSRRKFSNKRTTFQTCFNVRSSKRQPRYLTTPKGKYRCFCCSRNFSSFAFLQRHRRAFTHVQAKLNLSAAQVTRNNLRKSNIQIHSENIRLQTQVTSAPVEPVSVVESADVGFLRPLRRVVKRFVDKDDIDTSSSEDGVQENDDNEDEWDMSSTSSDDMDIDTSINSSTSDDESKFSASLPPISSKSKGRNKTASKSHAGRISLCFEPNKNVKKEYFCDLDSCNEGFVKEQELVVHKRLHGNFRCKFCSTIENHANSLALHELSHHHHHHHHHQQPDNISKVGKYSCARCSFCTPSKKKYLIHHAWVHQKLRCGTEICSVCQVPLTFRSKQLHMRSHHDMTGVDARLVKKCGKCSAYFLKRTQLQLHIIEMHNEDFDYESSDGVSANEEDVAPPHVHPNKCPNCGNRYKRPSNLKKHIEKATCKKTIKVKKFDKIEKKFKCDVNSCNKRFGFEGELEVHKKHHGEFKCQFCNVVKTFAPNLAWHEKIHEMGKQDRRNKIHCVRCNHTVNGRWDYVSHFLKQHLSLPMQVKRVMCPVCKILCTKSSFKNHYKTFHDTNGVDPNTVHKCDKCPATFLKGSQLAEHTKRVHDSSGSGFTPKTAQPIHCGKTCNVNIKDCRKTFETSEDLENHQKLHGNFTCSYCPVQVNYASKLAIHESTHVPPSKSFGRGKAFTCSRCTSIFNGRFHYVTHFLEAHLSLPADCVTCQNCGDKYPEHKELAKHIKFQHSMEGRREECDKCPAFFNKPVQLVKHKKKMHGEDNSTCVDCGKKYAKPFSLRTHRSVVHKKKEVDFPLGCDVPNCERRFERKGDLEWHKQRVHNGKGDDKSMVCHTCGKKCSTKTAFTTHMKFHDAPTTSKKKLDLREYICDECGKIFKSSIHLGVHQLSHTGPDSWKYCCLFCKKKSATKQLCMEHLRTHTNEKPFICEYCGEEYAHGHNLRNHKNKQHNANDRPQLRKVVNGRVSRKGQKLPPRLGK